jgi:hypothetical protein
VAGVPPTADHEPHDVRPILKLARSRAVTDGLQRHGGQPAERVAHRRQDRGTGGRDQLRLRVDAHERRAAEHREHGGSRRGQRAVRRVHQRARVREGRTHEAFDSQFIEHDGGAAEVDQRVDGAELVQVDLVDRATVNLGLC